MTPSTAQRAELDEAVRGRLSDMIPCFLGDTDRPGLLPSCVIAGQRPMG